MDDQDSNNQVITIQPEISQILGLKDDFDLSPDEYLQLVREKLAQFDILTASKNITPEQDEEYKLLATKVREIREQKRKGEVKYTTGKVGKKINVDSFFDRKQEQTKEPENRIVDPSKLLPGTAKNGELIKYKSQKLQELKQDKPEEESNKELFTIQKILNSILDSLKNQFKFDQKKTEEQRREKEIKKRQKKESGLEKGFEMIKSAAKKMLAPFKNILDQIFRYFFFTFLGKMFTDLMNWLSDPKNKKKVEVLGRFLKDWWPLLLGAYLAFGTPLGLFIRGTIKLIAGFTSKILKLLPRLLNLSKNLVTSKPARAAGSTLLNIAKSPFFWFPAALAGLGALANEVTGQRKAAPVQVENKARAQTGKGLGVQGVGGVGDMGPTTPYGLLQGVRRGGIIRGYSNGAKVGIDDGYSGVDSDTGVSITGAGRDTQLIAARPGEVVLTPDDVGTIQKTTGFDVYNFVKNRKPSYTSFDKIKMSGEVPLANSGGILGFASGGTIGRAPARTTSSATPVLQLGARMSGDPNHRYDPSLARSIPLLYRILQTGRFKQKGWGDKKFLNYLTSRLLIESSNFSRSKEMYESNPNDPPGKPGYTYFSGYSGMNGNKNSDDAYNFRGRGAIQLTGRSRYEGLNKWLKSNGYKGYDVVRNPDLLSTDPKVQALSTIYYLEDREETFGVNFADMARRGDSKSFTFNINGGYNHLAETQENLRRIEGLPGGVNYGTGFAPPTKPSPSVRPNQINPIAGAINSVRGLFRPPSSAASERQRPTKNSKRWAMDPRGWFGMQGGGSIMPITTRTGVDIPGGQRGADTQLVAVQPGEEFFNYVLPKDAAQRGVGARLLQISNQLVGDNDSNSSAAKLGFRNKSIDIKPPPNRLNNTVISAPINTSTSGGMKGSAATNSQDVYGFSPVLETAGPVRKMYVDMYGILD